MLSAVAATVMAILGNLVITPMWLGVPLDAVVAMILPILTPFNLEKGGHQRGAHAHRVQEHLQSDHAQEEAGEGTLAA